MNEKRRLLLYLGIVDIVFVSEIVSGLTGYVNAGMKYGMDERVRFRGTYTCPVRCIEVLIHSNSGKAERSKGESGGSAIS